ncbi:MAG: hypothetical protein SPI77_01620 [Corynebacterium sp.]|nr:hypothetical protein [Corynebacterium sp.]
MASEGGRRPRRRAVRTPVEDYDREADRPLSGAVNRRLHEGFTEDFWREQAPPHYAPRSRS